MKAILHLGSCLLFNRLRNIIISVISLFIIMSVESMIALDTFIKPFTLINKLFTSKDDKITKADIYNKIGNGGLSLRKVNSFINACELYQDKISEFTQNRHHLYNEDVFWAIIPQEFLYPTTDEAMDFGFDTNPKYCLRMKQGKLPFGCHSWTKPRFYKFWKDYITL